MPTSTRRERARAATVDEIKSTALRLMRESGSTDVRFSDVARSMDMTAPALYRYYGGREELLAALIADAYSDLADHMAAAGDVVPRVALAQRFEAVLRSYRAWATADPTRFALVFGAPLPGYATPQGLGVVESATRAMATLEAIIVEAAATGGLGPALLTSTAPAFDDAVPHVRATQAGPLAPAAYQAMLQSWLAIHGFVSLGVFGHLDWLPAPAREALFESTIEAATRAVGLAGGRPGTVET